MRSAFITPSRARCSLGTSVAVFTPFVATLLYELTSTALQRKLFNCIKATANSIVLILVDIATVFDARRLAKLFRLFSILDVSNERQLKQ